MPQYAVLAAAFSTSLGGALLAAKRSGRDLPERIPVQDLALLAVATQQSSRLLSRDAVTRFVREPVTEVDPDGDAPPAELPERPRVNQGQMRRAVGELMGCTICMDMWMAAGAVIGFTFAPRATRTISSVLAVKAGADVLQLAYARFASR